MQNEYTAHPLVKGVRIAIVTSALASPLAMAQEDATSSGPATTLDRIEVTGSRIRQVDTETAQPVLSISRQDIERQGFQTIADILQNISAAGSPPISRAQPLSSGEEVGGTFISLRNLDARRTLVLLNGRRLGITTDGLSDVSTIPAVAVERIEVLKDGASSIYGSDAIAGVINIITRSSYEGAVASAYYGQYGEGDGAATRADMMLGFSGDRGSLTLGAEWVKEDGVAASDRPYSAFPRSDRHPTDQWTTVHAGGGFITSAANQVPGVAAGTRVVLRPGGDPRNAADYVPQDRNTGSCSTATPSTGCRPGSTADKSNANEQMDLRTPMESRSVFVDGILDITDNVRFRTNFLYNNRVSERTIAGYPLEGQQVDAPFSAQSHFNPTGVQIDQWWRRTWEVPRNTESDMTTYRFLGAFEGTFEFAERYFDWDVSYMHNSSKQLQSGYGNIHLANLRNAIGPSFVDPVSGKVVCGAPGSVVVGCVPFNPLVPNGVVAPGGLTGNEDLQNYLFQEDHARGNTSTTLMSANLSGSLFTLPAGDLGFAIGAETRREEGEFVPDPLSQTGGSTNLGSGPTRGDYTVDEVYAELQVPLLSEQFLAQELSLSVATRYSDYDTFGDTTNSKFGLKWKPIDSVMLRATYADGFRAPTIADLYGGSNQTFAFYTDPCDTNFGSSRDNPQTRANCRAAMGALADTYRQLGQGLTPVGSAPSQSGVPFTEGSNPLLEPELSTSKTIGAVWSPTFVEGLNFSLDWWNIHIENTIVPDDPTTILNDCYIQGIADRCSAILFSRDPVLGYVDEMSFGQRNAGYREVEGYDFDVTYRFDTEGYGAFKIQSNSSYTVSDVLVSTNDPRYPLSNVGRAVPTASFRLRSNLNIGWEMGSFGVSWIARYYSGLSEACTYFVPGATEPNLECNEIKYAPTGALNPDGSPASSLQRYRETGSTTFNDVQLRWTAPWNATVTVGVNNVFDRVGPVMYSRPQSSFSYYGGFDIGRFMYLKYTQRF
ncbi:TonB-dependent receptor plug domain-containing protein [Lysobacter soli]|uniref:TonB-dependent receptor plug domain-containing protein n=1 Tax=Lysobacter soli TaxID=453783 RepID=UPI00240F4366|nr:TonB-dependent receptor [Lysobacter soli]MDG2517152.1 TonB-dependent receptor [Lysobacter soli]